MKVGSPAARNALAFLVFIIILAACYGRALGYPFVFDDAINVTENPYIRLTEPSWEQMKRAVIQDKFQLRPLSNFTFALDHYLHRLNPKIMRAENVALHALATFLLYLVILKLAGKREGAAMAAGAAALIWALNPAQVQAVTYIVQRQTLLATLGSLAAFLFYLEAAGAGKAKKKWAMWALSVASMALAALSKETGWTAPVIVVLYEFLVRERGEKISGKTRATIAAGFAALAAVGTAVLVLTGILPTYLEGYASLGYGPLERMATEARVVVGYVLTSLVPHSSRLALDHEVAVSGSLLDPWTTLASILILCAAVGGAVAARRRSRLFLFLVLGFLVSLAPESTFIPLDLMNDHRAYGPSLFIVPPLAVWLIGVAGVRRAMAPAAACVILLAGMTVSRNAAWSSARTLWADSVAKSPGLNRPWSNLCGAMAEEGDDRGARSVCKRAMALAPDKAFPVANLAIAVMRSGDSKTAGELFRRAATLEPDVAMARYNLGAYLELSGDPAAALSEYDAAIASDEFHAGARLGRARILAGSGARAEAEAELELILDLFPGHAGAADLLRKIRSGPIPSRAGP